MPLYLSPEEKRKKKKKRLPNDGGAGEGVAAALELFSKSALNYSSRYIPRKPRRPRGSPTSEPRPAQHHTRVKVVETLTKTHQMEGDGLLLLLYYQLFKKTWNSRKEFQSCPGARCPDTVVYEHNFPQHWFTYDSKHQEVLKRPGSYLDTAQIFKYFSRPVIKDLDVVAQYLCTQENPQTEETEISVEFFTEETLKEFLHNRKNRPDGVLQRFIPPKGEHNFQIQAVWSPKVTLVYKRTNNYRIKDKVVGPYTRAVTCDGPPHYSREDLLAEKTREEVVSLCNNFVEHFHSTEHKPVSRVVLYFKVDDRDNLWVMWASSLRIGTTKFNASHQRTPLNLSTKFTTPEAEQQSREDVEGEDLEKKLLIQDIEMYRISSDFIFATSCCCSDVRRPFSALNATGTSASSSSVCSGQRGANGMQLIRQNFTVHGTAAGGKQLTIQDRPGTTNSKRESPRTAALTATSDRPPFLPSPRQTTAVPPLWSRANPFHKQGIRFQLEGCMSPWKANGTGSPSAVGASSKSQQGGAGKGGQDSDADDKGCGWWQASARTAEAYRAIQADEAKVRSWAEDQLYHIYSHTLNHGLKVLYVMKPPLEIWDILCSGDHSNTKHVTDLLSAMGLGEYESDDIDMSDARPSYFFAGYGCSARIQSQGVKLNPLVDTPQAQALSNRPMAQLETDVNNVISKIFEEVRNDLKQWSQGMPKQHQMLTPRPPDVPPPSSSIGHATTDLGSNSTMSSIGELPFVNSSS